MIKILFICLGNICRSPMAEFLLKDMVKKKGMADRFYIRSCATSAEEIWNGRGNPVHHGTKKKLEEVGISCEGKSAVQLKRTDYHDYDYLICMDSQNIINIERICGKDRENKVFRLLDFTEDKRDVADPWYTGDFEKTYEDIVKGLEAFLNYLGI
ncbi:MAG: low molecular weight phosphotyrosine protein phosphatase [Bacteroidales bacterium]|nr:low molecular weight phosphotyrosine protein phosphatase [Clostridium sp.]MCM1203989.1 low molecular weight phosphotyrosine protein phosphatase [Bacteroidales bacterium]